jgi:ABC-2 type transport system ATP-binding protein
VETTYNAQNAIVVTNLCKDFGNLYAADNISFTVQSGSITVLLGGNGAGKTTTSTMLFGLLLPSGVLIHVLKEVAPGDDMANEIIIRF